MARMMRLLNKLAQLYGVQTAYTDVLGARHRASRQSLYQVLAALGAPLDSAGGVEEAIRLRRREIWARVCEPILIAWEGQLPEIDVRIPGTRAAHDVHLRLEGEMGDRERRAFVPSDLPTVSEAQVDGSLYVVKRFPGFRQLPLGYHRLRVEAGASGAEALIISAPRRAFSPTLSSDDAGEWGVLAPMYALHSRRSLGAGDLADFESLWQWTTTLGGRVTATLPILATYLDEPFDPSPYSPISRLFWNEFYLALDRAPELAACTAARELLNSAAYRAVREAFREAPSSIIDGRWRFGAAWLNYWQNSASGVGGRDGSRCGTTQCRGRRSKTMLASAPSASDRHLRGPPGLRGSGKAGSSRGTMSPPSTSTTCTPNG